MRLDGVLLLAIVVSAAPPVSPATANPRPADREMDWLSLNGSGLIALPDTSTLAPGRVSLAAGVDNRDRDPLKMDVLDFDAAWTIGVAPRLETYGHVVMARAITVSPRPTLFPSRTCQRDGRWYPRLAG